MTSKISANNQISLWSIMREDLRHRTWMIALSLLGSFLASPVTYLFFKDVDRTRYMYLGSASGNPLTRLQTAQYIARDLADHLCGAHLVTQMFVLMFGACIVAIFGFHHLYSRKTADLWHSIPVTRGRLFLAYWLNGFLIWLIPFLAGNLCVYLLMLVRIGMPSCFGIVSAAMAKMLLVCILCFLIVYNGSLVAVTISGNLMNALLNTLLYGLITFVGNTVITFCMAQYFDTWFDNGSSYLRPLFVGLSPLASPVCIAAYFSDGKLLSGCLEILIISVLFLLVNFALALWLHGKRASELAEHGVEAKWYRIPMRFAVSFLSGLLLALFFDSFTHRGAWGLFGALFGSVLAFAVANILYHGGFKYLFLHKLQLALAALLSCVGIGIFHYDLFGYDSYLPDAADIKGCSFYCDALMDESYRIHKDENGRYYRDYVMMPSEQFYCTDAQAIHDLLETLIEPEYGSYRGCSFAVRVDTSRGSYYRRYFLRNDSASFEALKPLVESESYRECYFPSSGENWQLPAAISVAALDNTSVLIDDTGRIRSLHEAYRADFLEHYSLREASLRYNRLNLDYRYEGQGYCDVLLYFTEEYAHTLALLREWYPDLLWTKDDLTLTTLDINFYTDGDGIESLKKYFDPVKSLASEQTQDLPAASDQNKTLSDYKSTFWTKSITDEAELAAWKPYLVLGDEDYFFDPKGYVPLGTAGFHATQGNSEVCIDCNVEIGSLPDELLNSLLNNIQPEVAPDYIGTDGPAGAFSTEYETTTAISVH